MSFWTIYWQHDTNSIQIFHILTNSKSNTKRPCCHSNNRTNPYPELYGGVSWCVWWESVGTSRRRQTGSWCFTVGTSQCGQTGSWRFATRQATVPHVRAALTTHGCSGLENISSGIQQWKQSLWKPSLSSHKKYCKCAFQLTFIPVFVT